MTLTLVLLKEFYPMKIYVKYESSITYHSARANVEVFVIKRMDKQTGQKLYVKLVTPEAGPNLTPGL